MDYQLEVVRGRSGSTTIRLADGVNSVGRHDECVLRIKSSQVSRRHCELFEKKGLLLVRDLKSSNGTFVNGQRVQDQRVLEPGDELTIGPVKLRVTKIGVVTPVREAPVAKAGDTAIAEAIVPDDEFEIDFDDLPPASFEEPGAVEAGTVQNEIPIESAPVEKAVEPAAKAAVPKSKPAPAPAPEPVADVPSSADDAVADFLLGIKLDEDD